MKILSFFFCLSLWFSSVFATYPLVAFSHTLVPKVQSYVNSFNHLILPPRRVNEITKNLISPCSSFAYIFVDQPGLTLDDLQDLESFTFLRTYALMSSTLGVVPRMESPIDFDKLVKYTAEKCRANVLEVDGLEEAETYIDDSIRVIRINLPELPDGPKDRKKALMKADQILRFNLRKLPSPNHTVIYTNSKQRLLNKLDERKWEKLEIFPDVSQEGSRLHEFERNNHVQDIERNFPTKRPNLLDYSQWSVPTILDFEVIHDNELLIFGILSTTTVLIVTQLISLVSKLLRKLFNSNQKKKDN